MPPSPDVHPGSDASGPGLSRRQFNRAVLAGSLGGAVSGWLTTTRPDAAWASPVEAQPLGPVEDFAFIHISDSHLSPRPDAVAFDAQGRSVGVLKWFGEQTRAPVTQTPFANPDPDGGGPLVADPPAFAIHTGDVLEYSDIGHTWDDWQRCTADAACPLYPVPGNHDNTWGSINHHLRREHGGDSYSFNRFGCHFVCLNSAGALDPLPCWDQRTLNWLREDLAAVDPQTPVFLAMHHPLSGNAGYASEFDKLRFWDVILNHHVVLMMDGHWHTVHLRQWQNIHRVNGGETYRKNPGYATLTVRNGVLRHAYRYHESASDPVMPGDEHGMVALLEKPIDRPSPLIRFTIQAGPAPATAPGASPGAVSGGSPSHRSLLVETRVGLPRGLPGDPGPAELMADLDATAAVNGELERTDALARSGSGFSGSLNVTGLVPGRHFVNVRLASRSVTQSTGAGTEPIANERAVAFELDDATGRGTVQRFANAAGIKTSLELFDEGRGLVFGDTAGVVTRLDTATMAPAARFDTGAEILHGVTWVGSERSGVGEPRVLVANGDGDLLALPPSLDGPVWQRRMPHPIYGAAAVHDGVAYFGDAEGHLHAIDVAGGHTLWSRPLATYGIEARPTLDAVRGRLYIGAWDGFVYGVSIVDGSLLWSANGPMGQTSSKSRYYGPADCPIALAGDRLFVADRGYKLGMYDPDGRFIGEFSRGKVAGVIPTGSGDAVFARGLDDKLMRISAGGEVVWSRDVLLGRTPKPPHAAGDRVAAVSDRGLLTILNAQTGEPDYVCSVSPRLFCLAPLNADASGKVWYAASMDGVVTRLTLEG